jgi:hypothetical protein
MILGVQTSGTVVYPPLPAWVLAPPVSAQFFTLAPLSRHVFEKSRNPGFGVRRTTGGRAFRFCLPGLKHQRRVLPPAAVGSLLFMKVDPSPELALFIFVGIQTRHPLSRGTDVVQHLQREIPFGLDPGNLPLGSDPGQVAVGPGAADLLVGIPDAVQTAPVQRTERRETGFIETALRSGHGRHHHHSRQFL